MQVFGQSDHRRILLAVAFLVFLVLALFYPIVGYEFINYDVGEQVFRNPYIQGLSAENLKHIFTSRCVTSYYPIRSLTLAIDCHFWGLDARGFKLTNGLIHLANMLLVLWLVLRVFRHSAVPSGSLTWWEICAATFSAGLLAVHPVVVEPVIWVGAREELLMMLGALGSIHCHLSARRVSELGGERRAAAVWHVCAALSCAMACLSNAVAAVVPLLVTTWDVLMLPRPTLRKVFCGTFALWMIGAATIAIKELGPVGDPASQVDASLAERSGLVLNLYRLNLSALVWPTNLSIEYAKFVPRSFRDPEVIIGGIAVGLTCAALWMLRRQKMALFGLVWFGLALGPSSQIMPHHIARADRFLYLPLAGLAIAIAAVLRPVAGVLKGHVVAVGIALLGLLTLLTVLSAGQVRNWRDGTSVWSNCLRLEPQNPKANAALADCLAAAGRFDEAIKHYRVACQLNPKDTDTRTKLAVLLATCPQTELRDYDLAIRLAEEACDLKPKDPLPTMALAEIYAQTGRTEEAIAAAENAITLAEDGDDVELAEDIRGRLRLFSNHNRPKSTHR